MSRPFHFDSQHLRDLAAAHRTEYAAARPYPHIVIDDFLPESVLDDVLAEFPSAQEDAWWRFDSENERKLATRDDSSMGERTRALVAELNSAAFIDFLVELTSIGGLVPDPHLEGGGLHQIDRGGHLGVHVDFNRHPLTNLDRRLNVLIYLNRDWAEEYGGALELWSGRMERCERRILPSFNRLVVFNTTDRSFHGHPEPLSCPEDRSRRSLALYYYSNGRPEENGAARPSHNTVWAGSVQGLELAGRGPGGRLKEIVRQITPPVLLDAVRAARRRAPA